MSSEFNEKRVSMSACSETVIIGEDDSGDEYKRKRYRRRIYVLPKIGKKCSNFCCMVTCAVITFLIFITTIVFITQRHPIINCNLSNIKLNNGPINYSLGIIISGDKGLGSFDVKTKQFSLLENDQVITNVFDIYTDNTIYWLDKDNFMINSLSKEYPKLRYPKKWKPKTIAADFVNEKLYIIDENSKTIKIIDIQTKYYRTIISDVENPCDIVLDPISGLMFIVKQTTSILRGNMDGSSIKQIILGESISAITIDRKIKTIYWANDFTNIACSDYEGQSLKTLTRVSVKIASIAFFENKIFWITQEFLWVCNVNNRTCDNNINKITFNNSKIIRAFSYHNKINNPCESANVKCEQLCLLTSNRTESFPGFSCSCNDGWQLSTDLQTCEPVKKQIVAKNTTASSNFSSVFVIRDNKNVWTMDYESKKFTILQQMETSKSHNMFNTYTENTIYWIDEDKATINSLSNEYPKVKYPKMWNPIAIAEDFVSEKLYIVDKRSKTVKVIDLYTKYYRTITSNLQNPCDLALDPPRGLIFIVQQYISILRGNMDGSSITQIVLGDNIAAITTDRKNKIIYWANDFTHIASSDYEGKIFKILTEVSMKISSIAFFNNKIVWSTQESLWLCNVNNRTCDNDNVDEIPFNNSKVFREFSHHHEINNPCESKNANCEQLCLLTSNRTESFAGYSCSCNDGWQLSADLQTCEPETKQIVAKNTTVLTNFSSVLVVSDDKNLWTMDYESRKFTLLQHMETRENHNVFDIYLDKTIFWSDEDTSTIKSLSPEYKTIHYPTRWKPSVLRIDSLTNNIYLIDRIAETVNVIDIQNKFYQIVVPDLVNPCDLVLDLINGYMFIALQSSSILRGTMSGASLSTIARSTGISAITIDRETQTIYWANNFLSIESIDYTGIQRVTLTPISTKIDSLAISGNKLYWSSKSTLWNCKISRRICENGYIDQIAFTNAKVVSSASSQYNINNPCKNNNGGCQHLCLLDENRNKSSKSYTCACGIGWELMLDGTSCTLIINFMLYTKGNFIRGRIMDATKDTLTDAILPIQFHVESLHFKNAIDFDYNWYTDDVIFSDDYNIYSINIKKNEVQRRLLHVTDDYHIKDVAFDWVTKNLYYVQKSTDNSTDHSLMVLRIEKTEIYNKTITSFTHEVDFPEKACPHSLIVHPGRGYLFYTAWNNVQKDIQRTSTSGKGLKEIGDVKFHNKFRILGIDYNESRLYWIFDKWRRSKIRYSDFDGLNVRDINVDAVQYPNTIYIHNQWIYLSNSSSIWRFDKKTGGQAVRMVPKFESPQIISGMRIVGPLPELMHSNHPCIFNNGGCQQFCFAAPSKVCDCQDHQHIVNEKFCTS